MQFPAAGDDAKAYGRRGAAQSNASIYRIDGESVTANEIGKRLGITVGAARLRLAKLRKASGPITWERLQK